MNAINKIKALILDATPKWTTVSLDRELSDWVKKAHEAIDNSNRSVFEKQDMVNTIIKIVFEECYPNTFGDIHATFTCPPMGTDQPVVFSWTYEYPFDEGDGK